ncbi:restriction endonuclease [Motiliproteus sp. SC1-56]|uniref:restriction endonuclease n=1 Tax=Motiliproteus sp. SC1-56 TaxID=2799565 RepID=UPI001A8CBFAB|nr:restriction endonuclease [Motiliproteus sp. SC1-56]
MTLTPRPWMKPADLGLFDLPQLPWPVFVHLVDHYFRVQNFRTELKALGPNEAEILLYRDGAKDAFALLKCYPGQRMVDVDQVVRLQRHMNEQSVNLGFLVTPGKLSDHAYSLSVGRPIQLFSGNRLRAKIENLHPELRRRVLDSIAGVQK